MRLLLGNLLLALTWTMATGWFTFSNLIVGFGLGYLVLLTTRRAGLPSRYFAKVPQAVGFACFYLWQLLQSNLRVAHDVVTPRHHMRPGIIAVPLDAQSDTEIALLANLLTLTPGTLSVDVSSDRRLLYVHAMYIDNDDVEAVRKQIKEGLERRVLELLR